MSRADLYIRNTFKTDTKKNNFSKFSYKISQVSMITILTRIDLYVTQSPTKNLSTTKIVTDSAV